MNHFYTIAPRTGVVRCRVDHRRDWKWFFAGAGEFEVAVVAPENWEASERGRPLCIFRLTATQPEVLQVPPGHFTASQRRAAGALLLVFSSGAIAHIVSDDFRVDADYWLWSESRS